MHLTSLNVSLVWERLTELRSVQLWIYLRKRHQQQHPCRLKSYCFFDTIEV